MAKKEKGFCIGFLQDPKICKKHEKTKPEKGEPCSAANENSVCGWLCSGKEGFK